ncbi:DUF5684 domain-containing protein [Streptococcus suis]|nr:DUF5684 domain-containing protein [Streptococcus suis]
MSLLNLSATWGFLLIWYLLTIISNYLMFQKAGEVGWKALIPLYNLYVQQCITFGKEKGLFIILIFIPYVGPVYVAYLTYSFGRSFGLSAIQAVFYILFTQIFNIYLAFSDSHRYQGTQPFFINN